MNRKGLVRVAACAALACAGLMGVQAAQADEAGRDVRLVGSDLTLSASSAPAQYLDAAAPSPRMPLMALLDQAGIAKTLDDAHINVGGLIEGSYTYGFSAPPNNFITGRVFDVDNQSIELNQLELFAERTVDDALTKNQFDIGARIEWRYGTDSRFIHSLGLFDYNSFSDGPKNQWDLTQAYVDFAVPIGNGLKVRVGKIVTPIGAEVIDPSGNQFYSHSYLFGYAIPFTNTGVFGYYKLNDAWSVYGGISRGWDTTLKDNNGTIDGLAGFTWTVNPTDTLAVNFISGPDQAGNNSRYRSLIDATLTHKIADNLSVSVNGDYAYEAGSLSATKTGSDAQWWGLAGYVGYTICPQLTLNGRVEYFNDDDGARLAGAVGGAGVFEATVGVAVTPFPDNTYAKNLVIRPEVRFDYASKNFFDNGTGREQWTAAIDAYYKF